MLGDVLWACHGDHTKAGGGAGLWVIVGEIMHFVQETERTTGVLVTDVNDCSEAGGWGRRLLKDNIHQSWGDEDWKYGTKDEAAQCGLHHHCKGTLPLDTRLEYLC